MDRVLITGGAGFIGSFLTEKLIRMGKEVRVFDNFFRGNRDNLKKMKVDLMHGDVCDKRAVIKAVEAIDTIFHIAAIQGTKNFYNIPHIVLKVNVEGTLNVIDAAVNSDVKKFVFTSSSEVYGCPFSFPTGEDHPLIVPDVRNPRYSYGASKIVGESICLNYAKKYGINVTVLRYHNVYGPRMGYDHVIPQFIMRIIKNEPFTIQGDGNQTRCFCFVSDAIEGTVLAAESDYAANEIFNIGNPEEVSINMLASMLFEIAGVSIKPTYVPAPLGETERRVPDISKAQVVLSFEPKVSLKRGLKKTFQWYQKRHGIYRYIDLRQ